MATNNTAPPIGIDLGTTFSAVAVFRHGKVEMIANELGSFTTPSYVAFTDVERLIGEAAKKQAPMNSLNTIYDAKRLIGRRFDDPIVQEDMKNWPFRVIDRDSVPKIEIEHKNEKKEFFVEEISSMIIEKMKEVAEAYLNQTVTDAVITVPAYFNNSQRQATRDAAKIAGLNVLRIINEPTAAAIAYQFQNKDVQCGSTKIFLAFDLGGGTCDVSILQIDGSNVKVLATAGDPHLGGEDFDNRLIGSLIQEFSRKHGKDIRGNQNALRRLKTVCEQEKRILSSATQTMIEIAALCDGIDFSTKITRSRFQELNADLLKATLKPVEQALSDAGLRKNDINEIILVGGSTRIPKIQTLLMEFFDDTKELSKSINPEEAVAYGAAIQAAILHNNDLSKPFNMTLEDVTPLSLGIEIGYEHEMCIVIKRNTTIPVKSARRFTTSVDNQTEMKFKVYQGESTNAFDNHFLGEFLLNGIVPARAGLESASVTFEIDANGLLIVSAVDRFNCKNRNSITIHDTSVHFTSDQIQQMIEKSEKYRIEQRKIKLH